MDTHKDQSRQSAAIQKLRLEGQGDEAELLAQDLLSQPVVSKSIVKEAAYLAFHRRDWKAAAERYQRLLDMTPRSFSLKLYRRLCRSYFKSGQTDRGIRALMDAIYRYPDDSLLTATAIEQNAEIGKRAERWAPIIGRTGPTAQAVQAQLFQQIFTNGDAIAAHQLKEICAGVYRDWPVEKMAADRQYQRAAASVYLGDYQSARDWLGNQNWLKWGKDHWVAAQLLGYCDIALGCDPRTVFDRLFRLEHGDNPQPAEGDAAWTAADFLQVFQGKSIAVVGPADTGQELANEIDDFDLVVRTNVFSFDEVARAKDRLGGRADVSYYTNATYQLRRDELYGVLKSTPLIPVLRRQGNLREAVGEMGIKNVRLCSPSPRNFLPVYGSMHAVQRIIWDLLKFGPARMKIFNVNFYGGSIYDPSYTPRNKTPDRNSLGVSHDPLQSFLFAKMMFERGVIEADPVAADILNWDRLQYIDMLQREFADHWKR